MKIYLSFRYTGEDRKQLEENTNFITDILKTAGHEIYCSLCQENYFSQQSFTDEQIYDYCLDKIEPCDAILLFVKSEDKSEGMELEFNKAIQSKKKIILVIKKRLTFSEFRNKADDVIEFGEVEELSELMSGL